MNLRPTDYESAALTAELRARHFIFSYLWGCWQEYLAGCGEFCGYPFDGIAHGLPFPLRLVFLLPIEVLQPLKGALGGVRLTFRSA